MKRLIVTGPESSGTRFVSRWLEAHPEIVAHHWSMPTGARWARHWPTDHDFAGHVPDALVFVVRSIAATVESQLHREMVASRSEAWDNITLAHLRAFGWAVSHGVPVYPVLYDSIVEHPDRFAHVFTWLGLAPVDCPEPVVDGNLKWLG